MSNWKANRLRVLRAERKLSQEILAQRLGISQPLYSQIERGTKEPDSKQRQRLARALRVQLEDLEQAS